MGRRQWCGVKRGTMRVTATPRRPPRPTNRAVSEKAKSAGRIPVTAFHRRHQSPERRRRHGENTPGQGKAQVRPPPALQAPQRRGI